MNTPPLTHDEELRRLVLTKLSGSQKQVYENIRVGVLNGVAHLGGEAASLEEYLAAECLAASVRGVRGVVNRIAAPGAPSPSRKIELELQSDPPTIIEEMQDEK